MWVHSIVSDDVWVQFQALATGGVVLGICTVACAWIGAAHIIHVYILVHHAFRSVRGIDHVAWKKRTFVQICSGTRYSDGFLSG